MLRDDGVGYGDYLEQRTCLIFLKMADEYAKPPYNRDVGIPPDYNWQALKAKRRSSRMTAPGPFQRCGKSRWMKPVNYIDMLYRYASGLIDRGGDQKGCYTRTIIQGCIFSACSLFCPV